ncbi:hypothetical protein [Yoonia sp. I 8.24]|uniref:hypothetical protein n=1 Tax=Yoonia sp. I 8.24 TaxID=1537229 RepID=UPI001EE10136|nr:hypothetical protein [Yoonia sp. I 8.24]MCG3267478.1 hypothetical protein [Yoonia sp. I 8.24]
MFKRLPFIVVGLALTAACAEPGAPIETAPVTPRYTAASSQLTANAIQPIPVRAYQAKTDTTARQELVGVSCEVNTAFYSADVVTPAIVQLPSFARQTPAVSLVCTHDGQTRTEIIEPFNKTVSERTASAGGGLLAYALVAAATNADNSVYSYRTLSVDF